MSSHTREIRTSVVLICLCLISAPTFAQDDSLRYFEFALHGAGPDEHFRAATSDSATLAMIDQQLALPESERALHINGLIDSGSGGHNTTAGGVFHWSWHLTPNQWQLVEVSIELCDGTPSMVEADLDYWLHTVGAFCPWGSYVSHEVNPPCCRGTRGNIDNGIDDEVTLSDLTRMIYLLFISVDDFHCYEEANVDESQPEGPGSVTLGDLTLLIDHLFISLEPLPPCP